MLCVRFVYRDQYRDRQKMVHTLSKITSLQSALRTLILVLFYLRLTNSSINHSKASLCMFTYNGYCVMVAKCFPTRGSERRREFSCCFAPLVAKTQHHGSNYSGGMEQFYKQREKTTF